MGRTRVAEGDRRVSIRERLEEHRKAMRLWFVVDMDDGIVRRTSTKREALAWALGQVCSTNILPGEKRLHDGFYAYYIGPSREDCEEVWIARGDAAHRQGFDITQEPLYPHADDPYELVQRTTEGSNDE